MKKIGKMLKTNIKYIKAFVIGGLIFGGITAVVAGEILASQVKYTNNSQSTVEGALDELYTRSSKWVNPNDMGTPQYYAFGTYRGWCSTTDTICSSYSEFPTTSTTPPSGKNVYTVKYEDGQYGVCIKRNGEEHCFRGRNYIAEAKHIQEVFSDGSCDVDSFNNVFCNASSFGCSLGSNGNVYCKGPNENCAVNMDGPVRCI